MFKKILLAFLFLCFVQNVTFALHGDSFTPIFGNKTQKTWGDYMVQVERKIKKNWKPPQFPKSTKIVVYFVIGRNGELLDLRIKEKSYSEKLDESAREAVIISAPFASLPIEYKGSSVPIEFSFDYNVVNKK